MFINDASTTKAYRINLRMLDAASGLMVGLGLFGTFWGLTEGISGFDSSTTDNIRQSIHSMTAQLRLEMRGQIEALLADIERKLTYTKEDGEQVVVANAIREILAENTQQTTALKSFSTDLAIELSQGFPPSQWPTSPRTG